MKNDKNFHAYVNGKHIYVKATSKAKAIEKIYELYGNNAQFVKSSVFSGYWTA